MIKYNMKLMAVIQKVYIILLHTKGEQKRISVTVFKITWISSHAIQPMSEYESYLAIFFSNNTPTLEPNK